MEHDPWLGCADTRDSPCASGSTTFTDLSSLGPSLWTTSVYITWPPGPTCVCDTVLCSDRSDWPFVGGQYDDELLARSLSATSLVTVAVLRRSAQLSAPLSIFAVTVNV